jgi:CHAT domain-containing protein
MCFCFQAVSSQAMSPENQAAAAKNDPRVLELKAKELSAQWNGEALRRSIALYSDLSSLYRKSGQSQKAAAMLRESAQLSFLLEDYEESASKLKNSLLLDKTDSNLAGRIEALGLLTLINLQTGEIPASEKYLNEGLSLIKSVDDANAEAAIYFSASELKYVQRKFDESVDYGERAAALWQIAGNAKREAEALRTLSFAYAGRDDYFTAKTKLDESLRKSQSACDTRGEALARFQMGYFHLIFNEPQKALEACRFAEALFPDDMDFVQKARLLNGISTIYEIYGDWESALPYRQKTLELFRKGKYPNGELSALPSLINVSFMVGNQVAAFDYFQEAREISGKLKDEFYLANANLFVADYYGKNDSDEKAIQYYETALDYLSKLKYSAGIGLIKNNLGEIYLKRRQFSLARNHFEESLEISRKNLNKFAEAEALQNLAKLGYLEGNDSDALKKLEESIEITDYLSANTVNSKLRSTSFSGIFDRYELYIRLLMKMHERNPTRNYAVKALQASEKSRARNLLENLSLSEANFVSDADAETVRREKEIRVLLDTKADRLTNLLSDNAEKEVADKISGEINELEHELEAIKANQKQNSPIYSAIKNPAPFDVAEFQRNVLDENTLLLEFSFGKEESYLWLIGKTELDSYVLPPREQIESRIERLREMLTSRDMKQDESIENYQARINETENDFKDESKKLSEELFGQIADKLSDKRLIIVPDGKLHYFPVAALPFPDSNDDTPILLTNEIVYEPSATTLALLMRNEKSDSAASKNLLVFSDPTFSVQDARQANAENQIETEAQIALRQPKTFRFTESLTSLPRLNASKDEAEAIMKIVGESQSTVLSGAAATREKALESSVTEYKIIHFASHGLINEERPELSGIVLSQIDEAGQTRNGVVRLQDIYAMNLSADAVVLSACSTGIGKEVRGDGLLSLNNAFLQAGAKSVVSSLWKVDDYATRELMKIFYREMASGTKTTSEALRRAQIEMRRKGQYQSPFYWAAFTVQGNFQVVPQISGKFDYKLFGLLIFPLALFGIYAYRRRAGYSTPKL